VLVVDDEPALRDVMAYSLQTHGFAVVEAADGRQAVQMACSLNPSLIVLDMNLPLLSGEEVAEAIRAAVVEMPLILVVTASGSASERAKRIQAADFLGKPFEIEALVDAVTRLIPPVKPEPEPLPIRSRAPLMAEAPIESDAIPSERREQVRAFLEHLRLFEIELTALREELAQFRDRLTDPLAWIEPVEQTSQRG